MSQFKPYIDKNYYTTGYKPAIQASIESKYTLGERNEANFEAFSERASEAINRLTNNTIERLGGIDVIAPFPQTLLMKATAALVEHWYLNDFDLGIINTEFTAGAAAADQVSTKKIKTTSGMRLFIPETVLWLVQTSGLADQTWIGVQSESELMSGIVPGFSITDFFTKEESYALFQEKGNYDDNFHKDIVIQDDLGTAGTPRYFKIFEGADGQTSATFSLIGGNEKSVLGAKMIISVTETNGAIDITESSVVTLNPKANDASVAAGEPEFIATIENGHIAIYVETKSGQDINDFLITDITPDNGGLFKLYTASDNQPQGDLLPKQAVVQSVATQTNLQDQIDANKTDIAKNTADIAAIDVSQYATVASVTAVDTKANTNATNITANGTKIAANASDIANLGAVKQNITDADAKYIIRDTNANTSATARMSAGYIPFDIQDVAVKQTVDDVKNELSTGLGDLEARVQGLEEDSLSNENFIDGNFALTGDKSTGTLDASAINGDKGPFDFTSGKTIEISAFDQTNGLGGTAKIVVGKTNPQSISLASGSGVSETIGVSVGTSGVITITETTSGVDVASDIVIDRIAQLNIGSVTGTGATKAEVALKQDKSIGSYIGTANTVETALNETRTLVNGNTAKLDNIDTTTLAALEQKLGL